MNVSFKSETYAPMYLFIVIYNFNYIYILDYYYCMYDFTVAVGVYERAGP